MMSHPVPSQGPMTNQAPFLDPVVVMVKEVVVAMVVVSELFVFYTLQVLVESVVVFLVVV